MGNNISLKSLKYFAVSFLVLSLILFIAGIFFYIAWYQIVTPLSIDKIYPEQSEGFIIKKNQSLKQIADNLEQAELINNKIIFISYIYYKGWASNLQAGEYSLDPSLNIIEIAQKIVKGDIIPNAVKITIPEGFNVKQIDARLAKAGLIQQEELINFNSNLEGYLFPDTYHFDQYSSLDNIILKIKENFNNKLDKELLEEINRQNKTLDEIIIMASILEKEVRTYHDKQIASGLFWNRIKTNYPLQSCATIAYVLVVDKWRYSISDTKIDSPYNTYKNIGLPPGPICNPGLDSIKAAVYPIKTDYNFFLSKPGTGETVFSRTAEEHNQNKAKYLTR